jgi:hypothetical protein
MHGAALSKGLLNWVIPMTETTPVAHTRRTLLARQAAQPTGEKLLNR